MMNGGLSLDLARSPENGRGHLVRCVVDGITYIGSQYLLLREDAWDLRTLDPLLTVSVSAGTDMVAALADTPATLSALRIHPYFRWALVDEHGLTIVPAAPSKAGNSGRWLVYDADTFVGVAAASTGEEGVSWATPLHRTKRIVDVLHPMATPDAYEGPVATDWWLVWRYARLVDLALRSAP